MNNKHTAQQRVDRIEAFTQELNQLQHDGVVQLDAQQQQGIQQYHNTLLAQLAQQFDVDITQRGKNLTRSMQAASFFGALALAASVFFLFYQYWADFSMPLQVLILIAAPVLTLAASNLLYQHEQSGYFARLAAMLSFACFVLNIALLGRIFDLPSSETALLVWAAYALLLAYLYDSRLLLAMAIFSFYGFVAARVGVWMGLYWLSLGDKPEHFFLPALIIFCMPLLPHGRYAHFASVYRVLALCGLLLSILVLSFWGAASHLPWEHVIIEGFYQLLGFIISAAAVALGIRKAWPEVTNTGSTFFVIFLYSKLFDWWWDWLPHYLFFFLMGATAILFLLIFKRLRAAQTGAA